MTTYRGRFAPTPSGPLHFGSMVAAIGSFLDARAQGGAWGLRIDDLDPPRVAEGAVDAILHCLESFALHWDGPVVFQSRRSEAYHAALHRLRQAGVTFACACSRKEIGKAGIAGREGAVYPGTCRDGLPQGRAARAQRVRVNDSRIGFEDALQGWIEQDLARDIGDFVLYRADHVFSYHLACAVDDAEEGITDVVRGADLIDSTPRQIYLQQLLGLPQPAYLHLPVALNGRGEKLSKQTLAQPVDPQHPWKTIDAVLRFLGLMLPGEYARAGATECLQWAAANWRREALPRRRALPAPADHADNGAP
jgi:glutamyl-Q tRNA(Asp) synthetase